jgi:hypothetical protein
MSTIHESARMLPRSSARGCDRRRGPWIALCLRRLLQVDEVGHTNYPMRDAGSALLLAMACCGCGANHAGSPAADASTEGSLDGAGSDASARDGSLDDGPQDAGSDSALPAPDAGTSFYGPGIGADSLDNHQVADVDVDIRFRAAVTANVTGFVWYDIYKTACAPHGPVDAGSCPDDCAMSGAVYACGTGGDMHMCIQTDDGSAAHLPGGVDLACVDHLHASGPPYFPLETFGTPPHLTAGQLYHLHWHNTDPSPTVNFTSVDSLYVTQATVPRQPTIADVDLALFRGTTLRPQDTPILQLAYDDAGAQGQGYIESWIGTPETISGPAMVRETFTVSGADRTIAQVGVRLNRSSGTGPLSVQLESAGTVIDQGTIPSAAFPLGALDAGTSATWATLAFASPHVLASGQSYALVLSAPPDTAYQAYALERGVDYAFQPPTFFGDGYAQFTSDGGSWSGFDQPGGSGNSTIADLQLYFE